MDSSLCTLGHVQEREFWQLLEEVLGRSYGRALAHDQVLDRLGGMTAVDALDAGAASGLECVMRPDGHSRFPALGQGP